MRHKIKDYIPNLKADWNLILYADELKSVDSVIISLVFKGNLHIIEALEKIKELYQEGQTILVNDKLEECQKMADILRKQGVQVEIDEIS